MDAQGAPDDLIALVRRILGRVPYGFLVTHAESGPDARLVMHLRVGDDLVLWIGTSSRSRKAHHIGGGVQAAYAVEDRDSFGYVAMKGTATVVGDLPSRRECWQEGLATFFPDGPESDEFTLVRLDPSRIELMSFADGVHPQPFGLVPAVLVRELDRWETAPPERHATPAGAGP